MAEEETINQTDPVTQAEAPKEPTRAEERIKELSDKVQLTAKERDEMKTLNEQTTRERDFYKGFSDVIATHPEAKNYQNSIQEKVLKGYSVEDATFAVLGKEGLLGSPREESRESRPQVAGGSASTAMPQTGVKEVKDMSQEEKRAQLEKDLIWQ